MPGIIVKSLYYNTSRIQKNIGGMLEYIGKREGVCRLNDGWKSAAATEKQKLLINSFTEQRSSIINSDKYAEYEKYPTRGNASELISYVMESYPELLGGKTYLDYIATRPKVERIGGTHGLFSDEGKVISLEDEVGKLKEYKGNVYSVIVSLKREDAERLGYNNAERWCSMIRSQKLMLAKAHNMPAEKMRWYGAFHNEPHHPHIHILLYSTDELRRGYITKKGIELMRRNFGKAVFRDDLSEKYDKQTLERNRLTSEAAAEFKAAADQLRFGIVYNDVIVKKLAELSERLKTVKGRKVYGYLPPEVKLMADSIVDELEKDESVSRLYELWYEAKCSVENIYTDHFSPKLPLSQENVFRPIRNAVIRCADEYGRYGEEQKRQRYADKIRSVKIASSAVKLGGDIADIFRHEFGNYLNDPVMRIDSRLKREIEAKKHGQNISV